MVNEVKCKVIPSCPSCDYKGDCVFSSTDYKDAETYAKGNNPKNCPTCGCQLDFVIKTSVRIKPDKTFFNI